MWALIRHGINVILQAQDSSKRSHIASGIGASCTWVRTGNSNNYIKITCVTSTLTQYMLLVTFLVNVESNKTSGTTLQDTRTRPSIWPRSMFFIILVLVKCSFCLKHYRRAQRRRTPIHCPSQEGSPPQWLSSLRNQWGNSHRRQRRVQGWIADAVQILLFEAVHRRPDTRRYWLRHWRVHDHPGNWIRN